MEKLGDGVKKVLLAGIGAVAVTAEKSRELLDEMVKKGELTVEQGKVLNEELKHNIKKTVKENVNVFGQAFFCRGTGRTGKPDDARNACQAERADCKKKRQKLKPI